MLPMEVDIADFNADLENLFEDGSDLSHLEEEDKAFLDELAEADEDDFEESFDDEEAQELPFKEDDDQETRFFNCHVCGDNWLSIKEVKQDGQCDITFIHQMGATPTLKRIAHMQTHVVLNDKTVADWEYYVDDRLVEEGDWRNQLDKRRKILKSICSN